MILVRSLVATLIALLALALPAIALANGGQVRVDAETVGPYEVSVFTSPTPLRVGIVDVSIQIIDRDSGEPAESVVVTTVARHAESDAELEATLTTEQATEAGYRAAEFEILDTGEWTFEVLVQDDETEGTVDFTIDVERARSFGWSQLVVGLLVASLIVIVILIATRGWTRPGDEPGSE